MKKLTPFADDATSVGIGDLTVENGTDQVSLHGSLDISRDKQGLAHAVALKAMLDQAVAYLQAQSDLPDVLPPLPSKRVANPFA